ncbi:hypothetical protein [Pseudomonas fluorescens]|uniref:hypothetical protein n=1 Tax=Pseudomonas fluorescens TaxID=294 RepID=UPI0020C3C57B|nr:hypothetical protein [Pseudomonas fluorescens]UTL92001.1 hypothetical protein NLL86_04460 [Pseudomonas fluorescens]
MPTLPLPSVAVIESADSYLDSALILTRESRANLELFRPACVLAALAIEIYLKAFTAKDQSVVMAEMNGVTMYAGALGTAHGHPLTKIFNNKISTDWRKQILDQSAALNDGIDLLAGLAEYDEFFTTGRYGHEADTIGVLRSDLIDLAVHIRKCCKALQPTAIQMD